MRAKKDGKAYIVGGGIAGLATALFLIEDAGMRGDGIILIDRAPESGGAFDGSGNAKEGYLSRGLRMFEESVYLCTYDLLSKIPSPENPKKSLKDDFFDFNKKLKVNAKARLMEAGKIIHAERLTLSWRDRLNLVKFLYYPESLFGTRTIEEFFGKRFLKSNFWYKWATTYAFEPWHGALEMHRYLCRFVHDAPKVNTMSCVLSAPYCEHDFIIEPLLKLLENHGVHFFHDREVTDLDFVRRDGKKFVSGIIFSDSEAREKRDSIKVAPEDRVFITNGSMMADATVGSNDEPPPTPTKNSSSWNLWKNIAKKSDGFGKRDDFGKHDGFGKPEEFGRPEVFCGTPDKSNWESFTITFTDAEFFRHVEELTGNKAGTGMLTTFKDSNWLMTLSLPPQPYFKNQPEGTFVCWGYGLFPDKKGNFVNKKMSDCSGKEILKELCAHLGLEEGSGRRAGGGAADCADEIIKNAVCIPCFMPYITAQFMPRKESDRPEVVPKSAGNFAFIGQFVEIPHEIVFTVECSIRSAKIAVKKLLNLKVKIPPLHQRKFRPWVLWGGIRKILR